MGYTSQTIKWQKVHRTLAQIRLNLLLHEYLTSPMRYPRWNIPADAHPDDIQKALTTIIDAQTRNRSKTKRLTTIIDAKGQKHQLRYSVSEGKDLRLPPQFYVKRRSNIMEAIYRRAKEAESVQSVEGIGQKKEEHQTVNQPETGAKDKAYCNASLKIANDPKMTQDDEVVNGVKIAAELNVAAGVEMEIN